MCLSLFSLSIAACSSDSTSVDSSDLNLTGSKFEIDTSSNLVVDTAGNLDWANVSEARKNDATTGQSDDSYAGGAKEDDSCPSVGTGSIPNNKSDLKTFGIYHEPGASAGQAGFLHLFWTRVQDPTGTTLMDFEFNQNKTLCANGVNPVRTAGDLLLEYNLANGGTNATVTLRTWSGSAWGPATDLTSVGAAVGTINTAPIAAADSDGLGALSARTFGEASIDLSYVFQKDKCTSFGSAFVKSRSSDAFNSALKDFIAPEPITITNCGKVVIRKKTDPSPTSDSFTFDHTLKTDPASTSTTFQLSDGSSQTFTNILFGNGYTVTEENAGPTWKLANIDCSASKGVTPVTDLATGKVTFDIDSDADVVDCTYTNQKKGTVIVEKVSIDGAGSFGFTSSTLGAFSLTTASAGVAVSQTFSNKDPGSYNVAEGATSGWHLDHVTCTNGMAPSALTLGAGETVKCTFYNAKDRGAIFITKTRLDAASGSGCWPHAGVTFDISNGAKVTTSNLGTACIDNLPLGVYTVTEEMPTGYTAYDNAPSKQVTVTAGTCSAGAATVSFQNQPLTDLTCSVASQISGATSATITCDGVAPTDTDATGKASVSLTGLRPGTYNCSITIK